ncbi:MAG: hypothetical protein U9R34_01015 [Nanoarchaeota archaeon]|nr:hypothetical protein [Nanoarchaeota archaeon]
MSGSKIETMIYYGFKGIRTAHEHLYNKLSAGEEWYYMDISAHQPKEQHIFWQKEFMGKTF